jgi:hypothetical protein
MAHYCRRAKDPTQSLTHHRLVQLLINRGFEQQNHPLNNPPINPAPAAEIPEIPEEQQQQNPPVSPEVPHIPPTEPNSPVSSPIIPESSHTAPASSTSALHILIDDSEPENVPCPIIQEKPPRKRKQIAPFPPSLRKKRTRASMRPPWMTTTLDPPPIRLRRCTSSTSQIQGSLPIPTMGTVTQEPATHAVDETQEPSMDETQETAMAETQEPATDTDMAFQESEAQTSFVFEEAETQPATHPMDGTQEPATDIDIEIQESEVEGAETLLSLHQEAETQASVAIPVAVPQTSAHKNVTATQEPVTSKPKQTMADVLEENEFLKSQLEAYQQELDRAREAYEKELSRYTLERTTTLAEQTTESICKEYICCQCRDIYYRAGYKIIQVPLPGIVPPPSPFEAKIKTEPAATQEPASPSRIKKEVPPVVNKAVQTVPMEEVTPSSQINLSTSRE